MGMLTSLYGFAVTLEFFALGLVILFLRNCVLRVRRHPETRERRRRKKWGRDSALALWALVLFFAGLAFLNLALFLQSYRIFSIGEPVARIHIQPTEAKNSFLIQIQDLGQPVGTNAPAASKEFIVKGERWTLEGNIIRFHSALSFLGFRPVYQLTRVQGGYFSIDDERSRERTVYSLVGHADESWWRWMYKHGDSIPLVELVYGSAITQNAERGGRYLVSVLPSGFALEKEVDR